MGSAVFFVGVLRLDTMGARGYRDYPLPTSLPLRFYPISPLSSPSRRLWLCYALPDFIFILDRGRDVGLRAPGGGYWVPCVAVAAVLRCFGGFLG